MYKQYSKKLEIVIEPGKGDVIYRVHVRYRVSGQYIGNCSCTETSKWKATLPSSFNLQDDHSYHSTLRSAIKQLEKDFRVISRYR